MSSPTILNVVSGKGGTGKSLLCMMLGRLLAQEGANVLLVDLDVFVRGLTHLFYIYRKERRALTRDASVADVLELSKQPRISAPGFAKERFYEVDLVPAVSNIDDTLDYLRPTPPLGSLCRAFLQRLRHEDYDYIIVDNRAGVDALVVESCKEAEFIVSVTESDPISRATNDNLLKALREIGSAPTYSIFNKVPLIEDWAAYESAIENIRADFQVIGQIPFDIDIFETFGSLRFWDTVNNTKYAYAIADCWNKLAAREQLSTVIDMKRFPRRELWASVAHAPAFLSQLDTLSLVGSGLALLAYFFYVKATTHTLAWQDMLVFYAALLGVIPLVRRTMRKVSEGRKGSRSVERGRV